MSSDIWETAKSMELQGKAFYEEQAAATSIKQLKGTFAKLAIEEQKHYDLFDNLSKGIAVAPLANPDTLGDAKRMFEELRSSFDEKVVLEDAVSSYEKALAMEEKTVAYYTNALSSATQTDQKDALQAIIEEEKRHVRLMGAIAEFVRRPKEWLEDAEWTHLTAY